MESTRCEANDSRCGKWGVCVPGGPLWRFLACGMVYRPPRENVLLLPRLTADHVIKLTKGDGRALFCPLGSWSQELWLIMTNFPKNNLYACDASQLTELV